MNYLFVSAQIARNFTFLSETDLYIGINTRNFNADQKSCNLSHYQISFVVLFNLKQMTHFKSSVSLFSCLTRQFHHTSEIIAFVAIEFITNPVNRNRNQNECVCSHKKRLNFPLPCSKLT